MTAARSLSRRVGLVLLAWQASTAETLDRLHLRSGAILEGIIQTEVGGQYSFLVAGTTAVPARWIPKSSVMLAYYADERVATARLNLDSARALCRNRTPTRVQILPAEAFGEAIVEAARRAEKSIWILTYFVSGSSLSPISDFYEILQQKAAAGVDVVMVAEFSAGTEKSVKNATLNFAAGLEASGIKVYYLVGGMVQHKKLIVVDGHTAILGSSNLTAAGVYSSYEMNVLVDAPVFVAEAAADFAEIRQKAVRAAKLGP